MCEAGHMQLLQVHTTTGKSHLESEVMLATEAMADWAAWDRTGALGPARAGWLAALLILWNKVSFLVCPLLLFCGLA